MGNDNQIEEAKRLCIAKSCEKLTTREFLGLTSGRSVPFILQ